MALFMIPSPRALDTTGIDLKKIHTINGKKRVNVIIMTGACVRLSLYVWGGCRY